MVLESDPIDVKLDENGDMDLSTGDVVFTTGVEAVEQGLKISLQIFRGECIYDRELGVPWVQNDVVTAAQAILGFTFSNVKTLAEVRKAILAAPHDVTVTELSSNFVGETRELGMSIKVKTQFGDAVVVINPGDL